MNATSNIIVSIIVPVYNSEKWILDTVNSVIEQTFQDWELLLVDDCSTDNSFDLMNSVARLDKRIIVFKNETNKKAYEARNMALRYSSGRYIAFLDSDDIWDKEKLSKQLEFMIKNKYAFTYTGFSRFKESSFSTLKHIAVPENISLRGLLCNTIILTSTVMIDRKITGNFKMDNVYYDDLLLWVNLLRRLGYAHGLNESLTYYRVAGNSLSSNKLRSALKVYLIYKKNLSLSFFKAHIYYLIWLLNALGKYIFKY